MVDEVKTVPKDLREKVIESRFSETDPLHRKKKSLATGLLIENKVAFSTSASIIHF